MSFYQDFLTRVFDKLKIKNRVAKTARVKKKTVRLFNITVPKMYKQERFKKQ